MKIPSLRRGLRLLIALVFGSLAFFAVKAVDPAPASPVSNVTFAQRTDGSKLVDVRYTLTGGSSGIALAYSVDGGTTYSALSSVTGDVGATVSAGTSKQIVWNAGRIPRFELCERPLPRDTAPLRRGRELRAHPGWDLPDGEPCWRCRHR